MRISLLYLQSSPCLFVCLFVDLERVKYKRVRVVGEIELVTYVSESKKMGLGLGG